MKLQKLVTPSLKEVFVQNLRRQILSGELPVGSRLPSERELAEGMQVSRAVVNGGITELMREGFLVVKPRQGTYVADYRTTGDLNTLTAIMEYSGDTLGEKEIRSILEFRWGIEHLTIRNVIVNATDAQIEQLGEIIEQLRKAESQAEAVELAYLFQHECAIAGGNSVLPLVIASFREPTFTLWKRYCRLYGIEMLYRSNKLSYDCIKARDLDAALKRLDVAMQDVLEGEHQIYHG